MHPADVSKEDETRLWQKMYEPTYQADMTRAKQLAPGQMVRISNVKGDFEKGYLPNLSQEEFIVRPDARAKVGQPKRVYKLEDKGGEEIKGSWYSEELQSIEKNKYLIEKVLRKRKAQDGTEELLVKWKGWPAKFNTWIPATDVTEHFGEEEEEEEEEE